MGVTLYASTFNTTAGIVGVAKTASFTPAINDLPVLITAHTGNISTSATPPTDDNADGLGTYSLAETRTKNTNSDVVCAWIRDARIGSATPTIAGHAPGVTTGGGLSALKVTGMSRAGAVLALRAQGNNSGLAAAASSVVLNAAALTGNYVIGAVFNFTNPAGITPRSSPAYAELADIGYNTPATGLEIMSIDSGETSNTITWGAVGPSAWCAIAIELDTSAAPAGRTTKNTRSAPLGVNVGMGWRMAV